MASGEVGAGGRVGYTCLGKVPLDGFRVPWGIRRLTGSCRNGGRR